MLTLQQILVLEIIFSWSPSEYRIWSNECEFYFQNWQLKYEWIGSVCTNEKNLKNGLHIHIGLTLPQLMCLWSESFNGKTIVLVSYNNISNICSGSHLDGILLLKIFPLDQPGLISTKLGFPPTNRVICLKTVRISTSQRALKKLSLFFSIL